LALITVVGQSHRRTLALQTAEGSDIPNEQYLEVPDLEFNKLPEIAKVFGADIELRAKPTGVYNCHGLVFASRRTTIFEPEILPKILKDDCYVAVEDKHVMPGDIILYFKPNGEIVHSGIVMSKPQPPFNIPLICSKWGHNGEFLHLASKTDYGSNWKFFRVSR
jgi:hypothetical protein